MKSTPQSIGTPLILVIDKDEWTSRSLESLLRPKGYAVLKAHEQEQGLELAARLRPDAVLIDLHLPEIGGVELCARVRELPTIRASTPILIFSAGPISREIEIQALRAGAWGTLSPPLNADDVLSRLAVFVAAKRDADAALEISFVDEPTGLYNLRGLQRRVVEISADTGRSGRPLACIVVGATRLEGEDPLSDSENLELALTDSVVSATLSDILGASIRASDVVGRVGESDFVIVAPGTDQSGARTLAERLLREMSDPARQTRLGPIAFDAGIYSVTGPESEHLVPEEFLRRGTVALRSAQSEDRDGTGRIGSFEMN